MSTTELDSGAREVLRQLFIDGATWDGDIVSKASRDWLIKAGLAARVNGWAYVTEPGMREALKLGFDREKEKRDRDRRSAA